MIYLKKRLSNWKLLDLHRKYRNNILNIYLAKGVNSKTLTTKTKPEFPQIILNIYLAKGVNSKTLTTKTKPEFPQIISKLPGKIRVN